MSQSRMLTLSHSFCISFIAAGESRSGRMESAWPILMYAGPREVRISRSCRARSTSFAPSLSCTKSETTPERNPAPMPKTWRTRFTIATGRVLQ